MNFQGFAPETFEFLIQLAFNNNKPFFLEHKDVYERAIKQPLIALEEQLAPVILKIDSQMRTGKKAISRIYRDTRFSKDKSVFRDHMWIGYKHHGTSNSEYFGYYFDITPVSYGYGMGAYAPSAATMNLFRQKAMAKSSALQKIILRDQLYERFDLTGEDFKRPKYTDAPEEILALVNKKYFYFEYRCAELSKASDASALVSEITEAFERLAPFYRFFNDLA